MRATSTLLAAFALSLFLSLATASSVSAAASHSDPNTHQEIGDHIPLKGGPKKYEKLWGGHGHGAEEGIESHRDPNTHQEIGDHIPLKGGPKKYEKLWGGLGDGNNRGAVTTAKEDENWTTKHEAGRCAIRGHCGKQSFFGSELPCPDNGLAKEPEEDVREKLVGICGDAWKEGPVCCEDTQVRWSSRGAIVWEGWRRLCLWERKAN